MTATTKISYGQALTEAIRMEMHRDPSVVCVAAGNSAARSIVTGDLAGAFGPDRIVEISPHGRPLAIAAGMAARGLHAICEARATELGPDVLAPLGELDESTDGSVVVRVPDGGPENADRFMPLEGRLFDTPRVTLLAPSTPADAKGMLIAAIRGAGVSCVLEAEPLYGAVGDVPEGGHLVSAGTATITAAGTRASVIGYGLGASLAAEAVDAAGLEVEVLDLRSLRPLDHAAIAASVGRTGKVAVLEPESSTRVSAEVAAVLMARAFEYLDGPLTRIELPDRAGAESRRDEVAARVAAEIDELIAY